MANKLDPIGKSSTGLQENIAAMISGLLGWLSGLIFFFIESDSKYVKFHAMQNVIAFGILTVGGFLLGQLPFIGGLISWAANISSFTLWIIMIIKTYQAEWFELPYVSDWAKQLGKIQD